MTIAGRTRTQFFALAAAVLLGACAQASSPPGAPPDRQAPRVLETIPAQGAVVPNFTGPVRFRFDKTLSERGARAADLVIVSPESGEFEVKRGGRDIKVSLKSGWQSGRVYHVTVLPGVQDRFGNARRAPYELVFSTGPEIIPTALGGLVSDRLTGRPVANARVTALHTADSTRYTTLTDTAGFYALMSVPTGAYQVTAFVDQNRDRKLSGMEARDTRAVSLTTPRDTQLVEFSVLALDTTPARLLRAEVRDSLQVRLTFDDFFEATEPLAAVRSYAWQLPDSVQVAGGLQQVRAFEARQRAARDTLVPPPVGRGPRPDTTRVLPVQELVFVPAVPLLPRTRYRITVSGLRNISGIPNGGGSVAFETPARRALPRDTTARPTKPAKSDSTQARPLPDTTRARRDSTRTPADTPRHR